MDRKLLKSKIHRATVTNADLSYYGSITIGRELCEQANLIAFEKVDIYNCNNGARFATYVMFGEKNEICLNGAAARHVQINDIVIIASYANYSENEIKNHNPSLVFVDDKNQITNIKNYMDSSINKI